MIPRSASTAALPRQTSEWSEPRFLTLGPKSQSALLCEIGFSSSSSKAILFRRLRNSERVSVADFTSNRSTFDDQRVARFCGRDRRSCSLLRMRSISKTPQSEAHSQPRKLSERPIAKSAAHASHDVRGRQPLGCESPSIPEWREKRIHNLSGRMHL